MTVQENDMVAELERKAAEDEAFVCEMAERYQSKPSQREEVLAQIRMRLEQANSLFVLRLVHYLKESSFPAEILEIFKKKMVSVEDARERMANMSEMMYLETI